MSRSAYQVLFEDVEPLSDYILVIDMEDGEKVTEGGIITLSDNMKETGIRPRWATVYKVGKNVDYVSPGNKVLVEHGRWTYGINMDVDGKEMYLQRVDPNGILLVEE